MSLSESFLMASIWIRKIPPFTIVIEWVRPQQIAHRSKGRRLFESIDWSDITFNNWPQVRMGNNSRGWPAFHLIWYYVLIWVQFQTKHILVQTQGSNTWIAHETHIEKYKWNEETYCLHISVIVILLGQKILKTVD